MVTSQAIFIKFITTLSHLILLVHFQLCLIYYTCTSFIISFIIKYALHFSTGFYLLLNQLKRQLFIGIPKEILLNLIREHHIKIHILQLRDVERMNSFIGLHQDIKEIKGLIKLVDSKSPLITREDADQLRIICNNIIPTNRKRNEVQISTDQHLNPQESTNAEAMQCEDPPEKNTDDGTNNEMQIATSVQMNVPGSVPCKPGVKLNAVSHLPKFQTLTEECNILSPNLCSKSALLAQNHDAVSSKDPTLDHSMQSYSGNLSISCNQQHVGIVAVEPSTVACNEESENNANYSHKRMLTDAESQQPSCKKQALEGSNKQLNDSINSKKCLSLSENLKRDNEEHYQSKTSTASTRKPDLSGTCVFFNFLIFY